MAQDTPVTETTDAAVVAKRPLWQRILKGILFLVLGLVVLVGAVVLGINTDPGRRFVANRIGGYTTASGLNIKVGRIERTLFTLRWFEDAASRRTVTAELNKGKARNSLARAVAFHCLGRFHDRGIKNQQTRAAALNLVTAAIILFNCRYLGRAIEDMRQRGTPVDPAMLSRLSPPGLGSHQSHRRLRLVRQARPRSRRLYAAPP